MGRELGRGPRVAFPIVLLSALAFTDGSDVFEDDDAVNIIGGSGRYALFHMTGTDVAKVLELVRVPRAAAICASCSPP